jgi:hypothetical protein
MTALKARWGLTALAALAGAVAFSMLASVGLRASLSYLGGLALVLAAFEFGAFNIRFAGRYLPSMTLLIAMLSYATTAIALGLVLAASSPRVVDGTAVAIGLFAGLMIWIGTELVSAVSRPEARSKRN